MISLFDRSRANACLGWIMVVAPDPDHAQIEVITVSARVRDECTTRNRFLMQPVLLVELRDADKSRQLVRWHTWKTRQHGQCHANLRCPRAARNAKWRRATGQDLKGCGWCQHLDGQLESLPTSKNLPKQASFLSMTIIQETYPVCVGTDEVPAE